MRKFDGKNHNNNRFKERDETLGNPGSILDANWLNAMQDEVVNTIEAIGLTIDPNNPAQMKEAVNLLSAIPKLHDAKKEATLRQNQLAGDGFIEWGFHKSSYVAINNGAVTNDEQPYTNGTVPNLRNSISIGIRDDGTAQVVKNSNTDEPIINIAGFKINLIGTYDQQAVGNATTNWINRIPLPPAPSGKEVLDVTIGQHIIFNTVAEAKAYVVVDPINRVYITERQDFVGIETWFEDISEKDVVYPLGNVQYGLNNYVGETFRKNERASSLSLFNDLVDQQYSAFGEWDTVTKGYGSKWSTLSMDDKLRYIFDERNNIFFDSTNQKLVQLRYRFRSIRGNCNGDWLSFDRLFASRNYQPLYSYDRTKYTIPIDPATGFIPDCSNIKPKGKKTTNLDYESSFGLNDDASYYLWSNITDVYQNETRQNQSKIGSFVAYKERNPDGSLNNDMTTCRGDLYSSYNGECRMLPLFFVSRLNQGAYHPVLNPLGCDLMGANDGTGVQWDTTVGVGAANMVKAPVDIYDCFATVAEGGSRSNVQYGIMTNNTSGHSHGSVSDLIYNWMVNDVRMSAKPVNLATVINDLATYNLGIPSENHRCARGRDYIPYLKKYTGLVPFYSTSSLYVDNMPVDDTASLKNVDKVLRTGDYIFVKFTSFGNTNIAATIPGIELNTWYTLVTCNSVTPGRTVFSIPLELLGWNNARPFERGSIISVSRRWISTGNMSTCTFDAYIPSAMSLSISSFKSSPWQDIVGKSQDVIAAFPNGVVGKWIPTSNVAGVFGHTSVTSNVGTSEVSSCHVVGNLAVAGTTNGKIIRSTDGGKTWSSPITNNFAGAQITAIKIFPNGTTVIAGTNTGKISRSTDSGVTWSDLIANTTTTTWISDFLIGNNNTTVTTVGYSGEITVSNDAGLTWGALIDQPLGTVDLYSAARGSNTIVYVGSTNGNLLKSTVVGSTNWTQINIPSISTEAIVNVACDSTGNKVIIGTSTGKYLLSNDGGVTWSNPIATGLVSNYICRGLFMSLDGNKIAILNGNNQFQVARSFDGGKTWQVLGMPSNVRSGTYGRNISVSADLSNAIAVGSNGKICYSNCLFNSLDYNNDMRYNRKNVSSAISSESVSVTLDGVTWSRSILNVYSSSASNLTREYPQPNLNGNVVALIPYTATPIKTRGMTKGKTGRNYINPQSTNFVVINNDADFNTISIACLNKQMVSNARYVFANTTNLLRFSNDTNSLARDIGNTLMHNSPIGLIPINYNTACLKMFPIIFEENGFIFGGFFYQEVKWNTATGKLSDDNSFLSIPAPDVDYASYCTMDVDGNYVTVGYERFCHPIGYYSKGEM